MIYTALMSSVFKTLQLSPFGVQILDLDLSCALEDSTVSALHALWAEHGLLVFREQAMDEAALVRFSAAFGELEIHVREEYLSQEHPEVLIVSNIREAGRSVGILGDHEVGWHHDQIYLPRPALGSVLLAVELPQHGGNTAFANLCMAYEALPDAMRKRLDGLRAVQSYAYFNGTWSEPTSRSQTTRTPDVVHPVVRTHPVTGRKALYLDPAMTPAIEGIAEHESRVLLDELFQWCVRPGFVYEHAWSAGDVLMWDNASTMHRRGEFDATQRRLMKRTTILPPAEHAVPV